MHLAVLIGFAVGVVIVLVLALDWERRSRQTRRRALRHGSAGQGDARDARR